ncbi:MAG TPA: DinB family protein [Pyrinomonadaceae bacterium]|nr:DinB family protein [Pyrinomonadaceae bacterium]
MIYNSLSEIFDLMDKTRSRLRARLESVAGAEDGQESLRPSPDAWSVAEIAEHLAIIEERLSKLFPVMLTKAEAGGLQRAADKPFQPVSVAEIAERSAREKYVAPETARPTGAVPIADSLARLERSRETILALRPRLEALDLTDVTYPHPVFGPMSAYQWLIFVGAHEDRHLRQIDSLLARARGGENASAN